MPQAICFVPCTRDFWQATLENYTRGQGELSGKLRCEHRSVEALSSSVDIEALVFTCPHLLHSSGGNSQGLALSLWMDLYLSENSFVVRA